MDLFNVSYEILLPMLQRFFAHTEETDAQLKVLADATVDLMFEVVKPLGDLVTTLPAGPEYPGRTAGPSFELFYESDYVLPHREAAWILLTERIREAADFCEPGAPCGPRGDRRPGAGPVQPGRDRRRPRRPPAGPLRPGNPGSGRGPRHPAGPRRRFLPNGPAVAPADAPAPSGLAALLGSAYQAVRANQGDARTVARLVNSVLRPLAAALPRTPRTPAPQSPRTQDHLRPRAPRIPAAVTSAPQEPPPSLWDLAVTATTLRASLGASAPPGLLEAVAALQDLAVRQAPAGERASLIAELGQLQRALPPAIMTAKNGPYLVTNVTAVRTPLGETLPVAAPAGPVPVRRLGDQAVLRRDARQQRVHRRQGPEPGARPARHLPGAAGHDLRQPGHLPALRPVHRPAAHRVPHRRRAVRGAERRPDGRDRPGRARLPVRGAEPGLRRRREARDLADWHGQRERAIEVTQDGPYRVTGGIGLTDATGADVPRAAGSSREHYALCRCGHSQNKPFCSGMHWYVEFRDPARGAEPTLFEWAGGLPALTRMTRLLYEKHVPADDLLAPLFATMAPGHPQREAAVLAEAFGGPAAPPGRPGHALQTFPAPKRSGPAGSRWPPGPRTRRACPPTPSSVRPSRPTSNGAPGPAARPPPHWDWGPAGPPAPAQASPAASADDQEEVTLPGPDETVSFAAHIKPLFREHDRKSMAFAFDLWSQADVQAHAAGILERLQNGTMPCDGAWPPEKIEVFRRWTESGFQP